MKITAPRLGIALVLVLVSGTVASATLSTDGGDDRLRAVQAAGEGRAKLVAHGNVTGLYPGDVKNLKVTIRNRYQDPVVLRRLTATVRHASPTCTRQNLAIQRSRRLRMPMRPNQSRRVRLKVRMLPTAPDACQGARFPLRFRVEGDRL